MSQTVNVLLSSFPGLSLPPTLSIPLPSSSTVADLTGRISSYLPSTLSFDHSPLVLTTTNNKQLELQSHDALGNIVGSDNALSSTFLPIRLSARLCGGKGGFGSQLRAAGGRMSSRRKGNQGENNGSSRNLDGRRLRTVKEAKALAEYLAVKPDMDKKEKEARRKRWEMVVEAAEKREEQLRNGEGKSKVDGEWVEDKTEVNEKARKAVEDAMKNGAWKDNFAGGMVGGSSSNASEGSSGSAGSSSPSEDSDMEDVDESMDTLSKPPAKAPARRFFGFDDEDDDELLSDEDEDEAEVDDDVKGKGKEKA